MLDRDSLTDACERSVELSLEEVVVEAALREGFVLATCLDEVFALGAIVSCGWGVLAGTASSAFAILVSCAELVCATGAGGAAAGSTALLTAARAGRVAVPGVDQTWSSTSAPPIATTTIVPKAIGKWFTESSCPW